MRWSLKGAGEPPVTIPQVDPLSKKRDYPKVLRLPLVKENGAAVSCACYSWQYGNVSWMPSFLSVLRQWAQRHQIELMIDQQPAIKEGLRESPYRQWIQHFLQGSFDWMMHMDADVMVHPRAPHVLHEPRENGFWAHGQAYPESRAKVWRKWVKTSYQQDVAEDYEYCNDGVWLLDRHTAALLLPFTEGYLAPNVPHEFYFNWWRYQFSQQHPASVKLLEEKWNRLPVAERKMQPAWFYHCAGQDKVKLLKELQMMGFLPVPRPPMTFKPWSEKVEMPYLISLPYRAEGDIWNGLLLKYALRSLEQYGPADWPLIVWGTECPEWLDESVFRYEDMLQRKILRSFALAEKVLLMSDDTFLLRSTSISEIAETLYLGDNLVEKIPQLMHSENKWHVGRGVIAARLHHELGIDHLPDFCTHTYYLFEREKIRKTVEYFGIWFKFPLNLACYGMHGVEGRLCTEKANVGNLDDPLMRWFNVPDAEVGNQELREWMEKKFPVPSRWEKPQ
jgi:hypothetical protein